MKVCFVSPFAYGLFEPRARVRFGGAEVDLFLIGQELARDRTFNVSYVVGDFGQPARVTRDGIELIRSFRLSYRGLRRWLYGLSVAIPRFWHALRSADADLYVQEGAGIETGLTALFCRFARRRFVYRVASSIECDGGFERRFPLVGRSFSFGLRHADAIVTEDRDEAQLLKAHLGIEATPIYDTTPLPDPSRIEPIDARMHILWVGRMVRLKRPGVLLDLAAAFPSERFLLVAPTEPTESALKAEITRRANQLPNVSILPGLSPDRLEEYYARAKLLLNTSEYEGYPNTFIEAAKYGVPVLTLNVNPDRFLTEYGIGDVAGGSVDRLRDLVGEWLSNPERRARVLERGPAYTRAHNDITTNIHAYKSLFRRLLQR